MAPFIVLITMASSTTDRPRGHFLLLPLLLLLDVTPSPLSAQSPPPNTNNPYFNNTNFNSSMAIVIVVLISTFFFFLGFFSIYIRQYAGDRRNSPSALSLRGGIGPGRSRRSRGLDPDILSTFPTLVYSDVRSHKIGKASLQCTLTGLEEGWQRGYLIPLTHVPRYVQPCHHCHLLACVLPHLYLYDQDCY